MEVPADLCPHHYRSLFTLEGMLSICLHLHFVIVHLDPSPADADLLFVCLISRLLIFFKANFFENFFQDCQQSVKHFVGPDLGPNCLQRLSGDDKNHRV